MTSSLLPPLPARPRSRPQQRFASGRVIIALILREMSTRYGRSPGGYIWAVLEPLAAIIILVTGFSLIIKSPPLGSSFVLFYASGYLPFNLYQTLSLTVSRAIVFSKPLLKYPVVTWMDAILARLILNSLTSILVMYLLFGGILLTIPTRTVLELPPLIEATLLATLLSLGVGTLNCALIGLVDVWDIVWSIITRPLFLISGVFFLYEDLPPMVQNIMWYNPLVHLIGLFRSGFYPMYEPQYFSATYVIAFSLVPLFLGLVLLGRYHRDILSR